MKKYKLFLLLCISGSPTCKAQSLQDSLPKNYEALTTKDILVSDYIYNIHNQQKKDSLKFTLRHRLLVAVNYGQLIIPNSIQTKKDSITGVDIAENKVKYGLSVEYFFVENWSMGIDIGFHSAPKVQEVKFNYDGVSIKGSGGTNVTSFVFGKYFFGKSKGSVFNESLQHLNPYMDNASDSLFNLNYVNNARMRQPRFYVTVGAGVAQSILLKIKGSNSAVKVKTYNQRVPSFFIGGGITSRIYKRFLLDGSVKYIKSQEYSPSIGSVTSYSGYNLQLSIGYIFNAGFRQLNE